MGGEQQAEADIQTDVVIVGGGIAGLTTAVGLSEGGLRTVVLERESLLGGRACSWTDEKTGDTIDIGPHILISYYPNVLKLLDMLGTADRIVWQQGQFITMVEGQQETVVELSRLPAPFSLMPSVFAQDYIPRGDVVPHLRVSLFALRLTEADIKRLDDVNAAGFLRSMGVSEQFIQRFWAFASMSIMNVPVEVSSAGALLRLYRRMIGKSTYGVGFADGGLGDVFAPAAQERIERAGGRVLLSAEVERFTGDGSALTGVQLADGRRVSAKYCVAAVTPQALRRLVHAEWVERYPVFHDLVHFQASRYVSSYLWFDRKLTDKQFWARAYDPNDLSCDFYDLSNIRSGWQGRSTVIATNCIFCERADSLSDEQIRDETVRELAEYLPEAARARVEHFVVNRIPMAIHCPFPGMEKRRAPIRTPIRNLLLAGDWIDTGLPASMESACLAAWQVAEEILSEAGRPRRFAEKHDELESLARLVGEVSSWLPLQPLPRWLRRGRRSTRWRW